MKTKESVNKAARALGKLAKGKPKNYSESELERRRKQMAENRKKRWAKHSPTRTSKGRG